MQSAFSTCLVYCRGLGGQQSFIKTDAKKGSRAKKRRDANKGGCTQKNVS